MQQHFREIEFFEDHFLIFYFKLQVVSQRKVDYTLQLIREVERVPSKFLKQLVGEEDLYEIRVAAQGNAYRILCFHEDEEKLILLNGFLKKTRKTPVKEIRKARKLKFNFLRSKT